MDVPVEPAKGALNVSSPDPPVKDSVLVVSKLVLESLNYCFIEGIFKNKLDFKFYPAHTHKSKIKYQEKSSKSIKKMFENS
jgi:hypothetical protein